MDRFSDPSFESVREGSLLSYDCSPKIEDRMFRGLVLAAPAVVRFTPGDSNPLTGGFAPVVVCSTYVLNFETLGLNGKFSKSIVFVAVDDEQRESFCGTLIPVRNPVRRPSVPGRGDLKPEDFYGDVITGYLNPNLAAILRLPERPARYVVYALLGPFESNRVEISVELAKGEGA